MNRRTLWLLLLIAFSSLGAYALGGFVVAPWWIKREFPQLIKTHLDAAGSLGEVAINPFKLTVEVRDLAVTEPGGSVPALAFDRLFADFEAVSLFKRAWTLAEVSLERPRLNLEVDAGDTLNLVKLMPKDAAPGEKSSEELPRLLLENLHLRQGQLVFTDKGLAPPAVAKIEPFEFELRDLSTLPNEHGEYTLSARLPAGGTLSWRGTVTLAPVGSTGKIEIKDAKLAALWRFVQDRLQIEEPAGSAALTLDYEARYADNSMAATARNIALQVSDASIRQKGANDAALTAGEVALAGGVADLAQRRVQFAELTLNEVGVHTLIDSEGNPNWAKLVAPAKPAAAPAAAVTAGPKSPSSAMTWQLGVDAINIKGMSLAVVDQVFVRPLSVDIGRVAARASLKASLGADTNATFEGIGIDAEDIRVAEAGAENALVSVASASLAGGSLDLAQQKFSAAALKLGTPVAALTRDAKGTINLVAAFERRPLKQSEPSGFTAEIGAVELSGGSVAFQDHGIQPALALDLQSIRALAKSVTTAAKAAIPFEAALQVKQGGTVRLHGTVTPDPQRASLRVEAKGMALAPFAALLGRHVRLKLVSGSARAAGRLEWRAQGSRASLRYAGNAGIDALRLDPEASGEQLIGWKTMLAEGIDFDSVQRTVRIDDVRVTAPAGRIAIARDRSTNLSDLVREAPAGGHASAVPAEPSQPLAFSIERIHVQDGDLDFSDQSLVLPFAAVVRELQGSIAGLSSQTGTRASLKLEGRVDEYGQARATGSLNPFEPKAFTDIVVNFRNVAMPPLSPYSATFAGRRIASGTLSLDLHYKLNDGQVLGENRVLMEKFTLGERVESPSAVSLPLDLAIALLTDADGKIDISVPVRGHVDQPEFSYGHLIWQAIRTVLTNIVTAPFRALASLFGGTTEKVDAIAFEAGRTELAPPEREKLARVIAVLKQRPKLRLVVEGRYDSARDGAALRASAARRALAERLGVQSSAADDAPLVNFDNAKTQRAIEALLEERAGGEAIAKFQAGYEKSTGKPVSRVNPVLALVGRGSADRAFYEAMFEQAAALQPLEKNALSTLATRRANAIMEFLKAGTGLEDARVATKPAVETKAANDAEITSALGLEGST